MMLWAKTSMDHCLVSIKTCLYLRQYYCSGVKQEKKGSSRPILRTWRLYCMNRHDLFVKTSYSWRVTSVPVVEPQSVIKNWLFSMWT